jgi:adenylate cyclase
LISNYDAAPPELELFSLITTNMGSSGAHALLRSASVNPFEEAIKKDPNYALAYSGLTDALLFGRGTGLPLKEARRRARDAATKALSIDPQLGEAHAALAVVLLYDDWDVAGAEKAFKRAIELSPSYAEGHHQYSHLLLMLGKNDESFAECNKFAELDPVSESPIGHLGHHYIYTRQYDKAIEQFEYRPALCCSHAPGPPA